MRSARLAYVPDPRRDGTDRIVICTYDAMFRPEETSATYKRSLKWLREPRTDHDLKRGPDAPANPLGLRIYRKGEGDAYLRFAEGEEYANPADG